MVQNGFSWVWVTEHGKIEKLVNIERDSSIETAKRKLLRIERENCKRLY